MPLDKQKISLSFAQGVDTKTDEYQEIPGKLLTLENGIFISKDEIRKRNGTELLTTAIEAGGSIDAGYALSTFLEEVVLFDGLSAYSRSDSTQRWVNKGGIRNVSVNSSQVIRNSNRQTNQDSAFHPSGLMCFCWEDSSGGSRYSLVDYVTNQALVSDTLLSASAIKPKPIHVGNYILIFYVDTALANRIRVLPIPILTPTAPLAVINIAINTNLANTTYDACLLGSRVFVAWNNNIAGISVRYIDAFLTQSAEVFIVGVNANVCITIEPDVAANSLWLAYYDGVALRCHFLSYDLASTIAGPATIETIANIRNITVGANNLNATFFYSISGTPNYNYLIRKSTAVETGVGFAAVITPGTPAAFIRSLGLISKTFIYNGIRYVTAAYDSPIQPTYFVIDENAKVLAKFAPAVGGGLNVRTNLTEFNSVDANTFIVSYLQKNSLQVESGVLLDTTGARFATIDFIDQSTFQNATLGNNMHVTGGFVSAYDGTSFVELGFHLFPETPSTVVAGAGGNIGAGTYQYVATYEWYDNKGQLHRSAPSIPVSVTTVGATSQVTVTISTLRVTTKAPPRAAISVALYRTQANQTIFYRVSSLTTLTLNSTTADTVVIVDGLADASIVGNELLYTTGGELENIPPPAANATTTYKNRLIVVSAEDPLTWHFSKQIVQGFPVEFTDSFAKRVDQKGGGITAVGQLDDKLILFKGDQIFVVTGTGPTPAGTSDDFSDAQLIAADSGCRNPRSVVLMPSGLMYQSSKGIYLLDRSLAVSYIGAEVEAYNDEVITSSALIEDTNQVRFTLDSGQTLTYDYLFNQWSVFTNYGGVDGTVWQGQHCFLNSLGRVFQETPGVYTDAGAFIKLKLVTSWLSLAGLQGFQRAYRLLVLGKYKSPHRLLVGLAKDFNPNVLQQDEIDATALLGNPPYGDDAFYGDSSPYGGAFPLYQWRVHIANQKCQSMQVTLEDLQTSNFGEGLSLSAIGLEVGVEPGLNRVPASRSFG
jgi:hypothetical protein